MSNPDVVQLIAQLRLTAPHSDDGYMLLRAANAIEDAEARVALAKAGALNEAAQDVRMRGDVGKEAEGGISAEAYLAWRAKAIEVGTI